MTAKEQETRDRKLFGLPNDEQLKKASERMQAFKEQIRKKEDAIKLEKELYLAEEVEIGKIRDHISDIIKGYEFKSSIGKRLLDQLWQIRSESLPSENVIQQTIAQLNKEVFQPEIKELTHPVNPIGFTGMSTTCFRCRRGILYSGNIERPKYCDSCQVIIAANPEEADTVFTSWGEKVVLDAEK